MKKINIKTFREFSVQRKVFYIALGLVLWSCGRSNSDIKITDKEQNTNEINEQQKADLPEFLFQNLSYDFGEMIQGDKKDCIFYFMNVGKSNLLISKVSTSCGCTSSMFTEEPIRPGGEGKIVITFDSKGKSGNISNYVVVSANTYPAQTVLTLHSNVVILM